MEKSILPESTVGQLVAADYRTADVFKHHGIDFCCGGKKTLKKVCEEHHIDILAITDQLNALSMTSSNEYDYSSWSLDFLIDYIINTHHRYVEKELMVIYEYAQKVATVHGHSHPEMIEVSEIFFEVAKDMVAHMRKEEMVLFPYVKKITKSINESTVIERPVFYTAQNPIHSMIEEHETVGDLLKKINKLTNNYATPADACNTFRVLLAKLRDFENDLHKHVHLENNILFPKAVELEKNLISGE